MKKTLLNVSLFALFLWAYNGLSQSAVFFSEYAEGTSNNKYFELYNNSSDTVDLEDYMLISCSNGCNNGEFEYDNTSSILEGQVLAPHSTFVVSHPSASDDIKAKADVNFTFLSNGDDWWALCLAEDTSIVDQIGFNSDQDTINGWDVAGVSEATKDHTLVRKSWVKRGNKRSQDDHADWLRSAGTDSIFSEWFVMPKPSADYTPSTLGSHEVSNLKAGDMAIVAYRAGANTIDDEFALLTFVDIAEGTELHFTDMMYTENSVPQCKGGVVWIAPKGIMAGDVILVGQDNVVVDTGRIYGDGFGLSKKGDQVIVFEGMNDEANHITALSTNAWSASGITECKGGESMLPKSLKNGTNAISHEMTKGNVSGNTVNGYYNGDQSGTIAEVKARVFDYTNWNGADADVDQIWPDWTFLKEGSDAPSFKLISPANGTSITVASDDNTEVKVTWESEENAIGYAWKLVAASGDFNNPALVLPSDNSGVDTTLTLTSSAIDAALATLSITKGVKTDLKWTVTAYFSAGDSLYADTSHTIAITRKDDTPVNYNFKAGDMAVVAYRMNASTPDEFALLTFVDIPAGAELHFADDKFASGTQCDDGDLVWTAPAGGIKAGTVIAVLNDNPDVSLGTVTGGSFGLSSGGDQIIIWEGPADKANHITALSSNAWASSGITCSTKNESELPTSLSNGVNAISHEMTTGNEGGNTVNAYYTGTMDASFDELKKLVADYKNWNGTGAGTEAQQWPTWNFTGTSSVNMLSDLTFTMFPNPTSGVVHFNKDIKVTVLNLAGSIVESSIGKVKKMDLSNLDAGIYLIKNEFGSTQKLIKQ